jgi:F0F1-type ATP synthase assembly protein I
VFGTAPWLMITGVVFGTTGGFIAFFRSAILMARKEDELKRKSDENVRRED